MKQKFLYLCFVMITSCMFASANAQTVEVMALDEISTLNPAQSVSVKLLESLMLTDEQILSSDVILTGQLTDIKTPKRLKRNATFSFKPVSYTDINGRVRKINPDIKAKYTTKPDKKEIAKTAALGAGGLVIKGLSTEVAAVSGAIKNEQGNRLKSSAVSAYEASPLSYVEKGNQIRIKKNQKFYLKFPNIIEY